MDVVGNFAVAGAGTQVIAKVCTARRFKVAIPYC